MDHCKCGKALGKADIDGGRCTKCGTMILPLLPFLVNRLEIHEQIVAVHAEDGDDARRRVGDGEGDERGDVIYQRTHGEPENWSVEAVSLEPKLTYRALAEQIMKMNDEQKDSDVTIHDKAIDEFFLVDEFVAKWDQTDENAPADGVLDNNHPYLVSK